MYARERKAADPKIQRPENSQGCRSEGPGEKRLGDRLQGLHILAIDEISIRKGHRCLTVVLNHESARLVWVGKDRKARTLRRFFLDMMSQQRKQLKAKVMDTWDHYILALQSKAPHVKIVFDLFHMVSQFN